MDPGPRVSRYTFSEVVSVASTVNRKCVVRSFSDIVVAGVLSCFVDDDDDDDNMAGPRAWYANFETGTTVSGLAVLSHTTTTVHCLMGLSFIDPDSPMHPGVIHTGDPPAAPSTAYSLVWTTVASIPYDLGHIPRVLTHPHWSDWQEILQLIIILVVALRIYRAHLRYTFCARSAIERRRSNIPTVLFVSRASRRTGSDAGCDVSYHAHAGGVASAPPAATEEGSTSDDIPP